VNGRDWRNVGCTQFASGNFHAAIASFLRARCQGEESAEFHREFANALWAAGDRDAAMREIFAATEKSHDDFAIAANAANFLTALGEYATAAKWLRVAIEAKPDAHQARFNRALYLLGSGNWEEGWAAYEARIDLYPLDFPEVGIPAWRGNASLDGKLVWVTSEQGVGDQIMFSRYVPWLQSLGASVIFDSHAALSDFSYESGVITRHMGFAGKFKVPEHPTTGRKPDYVVPLMSLPHRHRTTAKTIPPVAWFKKVAAPYRVKVDGEEGKQKIGLVWAGSKDHPGDAARSMPLQALLPLTGNDKCEFYSFQVGERAADVQTCGAGPLMHHLPLRLWMQTAAALREMDALVTVDTGIAHLAGSLGVKTYLMLSTEPDWRWLTEGEATPWYPSLKLVRQTSRGDWNGVVRRVAAEIER
jgi:tetratricopeptide (TPR) repeat protein